MRRSQLLLLRSLAYDVPRCQIRLLHVGKAFRQEQQSELTPITQSPLKNARNSMAPLRLDSKFSPQPLGAPIGFPFPPQPSIEMAGKNEGSRARRLTKDGFIESNLEERDKLKKAYAKPYFRDFRNLDYHNGKFFLGNPRIFKASQSLYFPNLHGSTLDPNTATSDTTTTLRGNVTLVSIYSRKWARDQVKTFVDQQQNPDVKRLIDGSMGRAQLIEINFEEGRLFSAVLWLFARNLRRTRAKEDWDKYFILRGIPPEVKETLGIMNDKVGYIYLLDAECKIRWAACGDATPDEKEALVKGLKRLLES